MKKHRLPLYMDVCALGRPYDDQRFHRIAMETLAVILITTGIKSQTIKLFFSPVHVEELEANPDSIERIEIMKFLQEYGQDTVSMGCDYDSIEHRARKLRAVGFGLADAMHVASAEAVGAAFVTCDDSLLRLCSRYPVSCWSGSPVDYCKKAGLL